MTAKPRFIVLGHNGMDTGTSRPDAHTPPQLALALYLMVVVTAGHQMLLQSSDVETAFLNGIERGNELYTFAPRDSAGIVAGTLGRIRRGVLDYKKLRGYGG